ncbi:MAG: glycosyltransferase [Haliscomenobacter sp.]
MAKKRVLVAPLDWGLGHAARSISVIQSLLQRNAEVIIASNGRPLALLQKEFPQLEAIELPPYDVRYPTNNIYWNVATQIPQIVKAVALENRIVADLVKKRELNALISDHRLGCFNARVPSVIIAHQLHLKVEHAAIEKPVRRIHYSFFKQFNTCWIPDWEQEADSLAGTLDHPPLSRPETKYIGPLSRIRYIEAPTRYDVFILLSGPEPQRTRLENLLRDQAGQLPGNILLVQGKTDQEKQIHQSGNLTIIPFLTSAELNQAFAESNLVVCRSGYSTLMDLAACRKKALLIPTPGQTEQEYLSDYLFEKGFFLSRSQDEVNLLLDIPEALKFNGFPSLEAPNHLLEDAMDDLFRQMHA